MIHYDASHQGEKLSKNARQHRVKNSKQIASTNGIAGVSELLAKLVECQQQGQLEASEKLCKEILVNDPTNAQVCLIYGNILYAQGLVEHAIRSYRRSIRSDQRNPNTHLKLATALEETGKFTEAVACYKTCLARVPNDLNALIGLGGTYLKLGKLQECERSLQLAFAQATDTPKTYVLAGELAIARGLPAEAAEHFQRALYINPDPRVQIKSGRALKLCGAFSQAIEAFESAALQTPDDVEIWIELSTLQAETGDILAAERSLRRAIEIKNDSTMLRVSLASTLVIQGKLKDALQEYLNAHSIEPTCTLAIEGEADCLYRFQLYDQCYALLKKLSDTNKLSAEGARTFSRVCRKKGDSHGAFSILEGISKQASASVRERAIAHFALGDAYDSIRDFEAAFHNYKLANQLLGNTIYNPQVAEKTTQHLIEAYSPNYWASLPRAEKGEFQPIFIMGMPRSGTSLVEQIVASHPNVYGAGELTFITEISATIQHNSNFPSNITHLTTDQINQYAKQYYSKAEALIGRSKVMTDKMPGNIFSLGLMALMFPNAAFVHCTRHPLDTCLSIYFQQFSGGYPWATNLDNIAHYYKQYRRFVQHWTETLGIQMFEVRYEHLVSDQETQTRQLIEYCGLDWDEECLNFNSNPRHVATASHDQVNQALYSTSIERWKNYRQFLKPVIAALGEWIAEE